MRTLTLIVKVGGKVITRNLDGVVRDIALNVRINDLILIHGGGDIVSDYSRRLGIEPKFVI